VNFYRSRTLLAFCAATFSVATLGISEAIADCNDPFGKPGEVLDFHLKMSDADWQKLLASKITNVDGLPPDSPACKEQFPEFAAEFRCGDEPWIKVGVRKKRGEERGTEAPLKPPLKIDFNEDFMGKQPDAKGQNWPKAMGDNGFRKLTLNNGQGNKPPGRSLILPLLMTEHVALRLLKREVAAAPGTAYAKVTIHTETKPNGEYHGVYILIEDIDKSAIRRRFGVAQGRLSKMTRDNCSPEVVYDDGPPNETYPAFTAWLNKNPGTGDAWLQETAKVIDLDAFLRQEAIREILVNGDDTISYVTTSPQMKEGNNFYAFDPRTGPRQYMPWDVDLMFGQQNGNCAPTPLMCAPNTAILKYCGDTQSRVGRATVCHPTIQKKYLEVMCQLTNGSLSSDEILKIWEEANTAVRPVVPLEKDLIWGGKDPLSTATPKSFGAEYERIKKWIPERIKSVQAQIAAKGVACSAGCMAGAKEACTTLGCAGERRCENGLWTPCQHNAACSKPAPGGGGDGGVTTPIPGGASDAGTPSGGNDAGAPSGGSGTGGGGGGATSGTGGMTGTGGSGTSGSGTSAGGTGGSKPSGGRTGGSSGSNTSSSDNAPPPSSGGCQIGGPSSPVAGGFGLIFLLISLRLGVVGIGGQSRRRRSAAGQ
jgi:CotH kinase protein